MYILTAAEMREADRRTVELGIPDPVLMENAGQRVVEFLEERFGPLSAHRIVVLCGKGNNGGDGLVVARQLHTRFQPRSLDVVLAADPPANIATLRACGCPVASELTPVMRAATLVVDALLGTGLNGPPREPFAELIDLINSGFPLAKVVAVDLPSGMASDEPVTPWRHVRADATVTFTSPQPAHFLEPNASACGEVRVSPIGTPPELLRTRLAVITPDLIRPLFAPRAVTAHKGDFGHVLVIGGAPGKTGAAGMAGIAALRAGAGLVSVAASSHAGFAPELMTEPLGHFQTANKTVLAVGPGLGSNAPWLAQLVQDAEQPVVLDADALNLLAGKKLPKGKRLILTPHPGEMSRLAARLTAEIQRDRTGVAREFASSHDLMLVLKGRNTLVALPDGMVFVNPTGGPAMATGGSGDILTGLIAGLAAQFPDDLTHAVLAAVWLHGRSGDLAAAELGEKPVIATDLLRFLPAAIGQLR
ncbi:MAG: NAD(P)H-hydrate dehydratase [Acidobacteria bacterium]|nr:NAD(P)H-hydrate dehydratase [Acidobacteriota bacterium]